MSHAPHYAGEDRRKFGALGDSAPDRWGQTLLRRAERRQTKAENRAKRALREVDFLLGVTDSVRQGALRLALKEGGPSIAPERPSGVPPLVELPALLAASERYLVDQESAEDLRLLLAPGSSLGGDRPKTSVRDSSGALLTAKFPKRNMRMTTGSPSGRRWPCTLPATPAFAPRTHAWIESPTTMCCW